VNGKQTILVVDDDPDVIDQLTLLLKSEGYDVVAAGGSRRPSSC